MTIWCLGAVNADHFYRLPHLPAPGETLAASDYSRGLGGKGATMAVFGLWILARSVYKALVLGLPSATIMGTVGTLALIANLQALVGTGFPILFGASRKRLIQAIDDSATGPLDRLGGSLVLALEAIRRGAAIIRVHDVRETVQALKVHIAMSQQDDAGG